MRVRVHTEPPLERRAFGAAVRELRGRRGLSLAQLSARAEVHDGYLRAVERAEVEPGLRTMGRIAAGLEVALSTLMVCAERRLGSRPAGGSGRGAAGGSGGNGRGGAGGSGGNGHGGAGGSDGNGRGGAGGSGAGGGQGTGGREPRGGRG